MRHIYLVEDQTKQINFLFTILFISHSFVFIFSLSHRKRVELMREMYKNEADYSPTSPESEQHTCIGADPFHDRFPWFRLIGRAFVYLSNLLYSLSLIQKVAIVNEHGDVVGYLRIAIQSVNENDCDLNDTDKSFGCRQSVRIAFDNNDTRLQQITEAWNKRTSFHPYYIDDLTCVNRAATKSNLIDSSDCIDQVNNNYDDDVNDFTIKQDEDITFRVIILQVIGIAKEYRDVFCQFNFLHLFDEAFSTEPIKNTGSGPPPGFFRMQNISVTVTSSFIRYLQRQPLMLEVFGHYQQHPLDKEAKDVSSSILNNTKDNIASRAPPRRLMLKQLPISAPVKPQKYSISQATSNAVSSCATVHTRLDILVWLEICELAPSGEYISVLVDHEDETPCKATFLMHQGIQRRIRLTLLHDDDPDVTWKEIRELVVGRVRTEAEISDDFEDDYDESILSLSLFPGEQLASLDGRIVHRFEAAWDTSLHSSILLNRVTPSGERVYLTLSAYIDLEKCSTPAVITKDVCVIIYARDATIFPRSFKQLQLQLFSGHFRNQAYNHSSGMYELTLRRAVDTGSPGVARRQRKVLDTSTLYVRGEENLDGWAPRGDSLLFEHQWELEKMYRLELTERIKHILAVHEKLTQPSEDELSKLSSSRINLAALTGSTFLTSSPSLATLDNVTSTSSTITDDNQIVTDTQRQLCLKYLRLMQHQFASRAPSKTQATEDMMPTSTASSPESISSDSWPRKLSDNCHDKNVTSNNNTFDCLVNEGVSKKVILTPDMEEIRLAPVSSRKGELLLFDSINNKWIKRWLVVRRPYLFIFKDDKDPIERAVISLTRAQVIYTPDIPSKNNIFILQCGNREFTFKTTTTSSRQEIHNWLYAINPLLAGEMLSKLSRDQKKN